MKILISPLLLIMLFVSCQNNKSGSPDKINYPSHNYTFVKADTANLEYREIVYVPVFSDIYYLDGTKRFLLTSTLSIRNTSLSDSTYVLSVVFNDSFGKPLRNFTTSHLLLKPLESIEFVIEDKENKGGAGASFIVEWGGKGNANQMLIQSVMIGTAGQQGISFTEKGETIWRRLKK